MQKLAKWIWLPIIPLTQPQSKISKWFNFIILNLFLVAFILPQYFIFIPNELSRWLLLIFWTLFFIHIHTQHYFTNKNVFYDLFLRCFICFKATIQDVITIHNPKTEYHYKIMLTSDENIKQDLQQTWLITPNLYPINLRILTEQPVYIHALENYSLIFNIIWFLSTTSQQDVLFFPKYLKYLDAKNHYQKCKYQNLNKITLHNQQEYFSIQFWLDDNNFLDFKINPQQLKIIETMVFPHLLLFSQKHYLEVKQHFSQGIIWQQR